MPKYSKNFTQNIFEPDAESSPVRFRLFKVSDEIFDDSE